MAEEEAEKFVSRGRAGRQVRKRRCDGWSRHDIQVFLDHYRATCNVAASAAAAGKRPGGVWRLRRNDPQFAAEMDGAHAEGQTRLEGKLILYCETSGRPVEGDGDEPAVAPIEDFDPQLALEVLKLSRGRRAARSRPGPRPRAASRQELIEKVVKLLGMLKKRRAKAKRAGK